MIESMGSILTILAASLAALLAGIGSAKGVGNVGEMATGVLTEDPSKFGKLLILQALPGTQGIYGLLTWFMILFNSGILFGDPSGLTWQTGLSYLMAALPVAIVGLFSAIYQGRVSAAGISLVAKRPEEHSKALVMAAMVETYAIFALLASVLAVMNI